MSVRSINSVQPAISLPSATAADPATALKDAIEGKSGGSGTGGAGSSTDSSSTQTVVSTTTVVNPDGTVTTTITYSDGTSKVTTTADPDGATKKKAEKQAPPALNVNPVDAKNSGQLSALLGAQEETGNDLIVPRPVLNLDEI